MGQALWYWVIPVVSVSIARSTIQPISIGDLAIKAVLDELSTYSLKIADLFAETNKQYPIIDMDTPGLTTDILDIEDAEPVVCQYKPELSMPESEKYDKESFDKLLPAHVFMPRGDGWEHDTVIGRKCDQDGHLVGHGSANLLLYTKAYEGEFQVGYNQEYLADAIPENTSSQVGTVGIMIISETGQSILRGLRKCNSER